MEKTIKCIVYGGGIIATGYALMKLTVPDEEQMRARLRPELQREYDIARAKSKEKHLALMEHMREASETSRPAWEEKSK
ncbi:hypothetical protein J3Q64DRAFT_1721509 [Phycomyces blakesleeanus]|uniref:Cytochrome b mRNA-processing protein 4 n=2 Tax=Phycomyces blakesleeanus TaxID=4837 RepID=A0A167NXM5_PHYB8|nr:hypothetical protein PHYBLDRAFT_142331 [Phycomyces blakesleeanus NRRL 1555(-)]OAD76829.1 hypothetical protein PHYBLDRAFT_142331 [Phycomyces blakesleeanus NRRL 1555(-)]|eukprot:XP_018294869.1 hypothetical protein PHYBLDRAFT_142331 [Phycomyces blakesleeanus NRRL 1555(-)]